MRKEKKINFVKDENKIVKKTRIPKDKRSRERKNGKHDVFLWLYAYNKKNYVEKEGKKVKR